MCKQFTFSALLALLTTCFSFNLSAQEAPFYHHAKKNSAAASLVSGQGSNIDVVYQRCSWRVHPDSPSTTAPVKYIRGNVTTYFKTKLNDVSQITFDFNNVHTIDSVKYNGAKLTAGNIVWNTSKIIQLTLPAVIALPGTLDSLTIFYRGTPPAVSGEALGYQKGGTSSNNYVYTLSESYEDRDWWPCKHDMTDKIDSMDIIVSVPSNFWVATNGIMTDSAVSGASRIFKFKHRYPIASYLVSLGVAKYKRYYRGTVNISGTNVPVVYNLFPGKSNNTYNNILIALDKSKTELVQFSNKYGDYPFKNEKHGYYEFGWGGGMEHQTFSAMGGSALTSWSTIAHELAHQWFGDKVTCATWNELWLSEGFARYNEILAAELVSGLSNPITFRGNIKTSARSLNNTPIYITNINTSNTIWTSDNNTAVYERGCMVVSMLRTLLGDTKFFQACRDYLSDPLLAYQSATTPDVERNFENQAGADLSHFINAWIYGTGNATYSVNWSTTGNNITVQLNQTRTAGASVPYFAMPVVLKVADASNTSNTTLVMYDRGDSIFIAGTGIGAGVAGNTINFTLPFAPATVTFDPNNVTMATGTATKINSFVPPLAAASKISYTNTEVYPNPASNEITVARNVANTSSSVIITDINGKIVLKKVIVSVTEKINIQHLLNGTYILQVAENGAIIKSEKLIIAH
jgi:aminopeptidase N